MENIEEQTLQLPSDNPSFLSSISESSEASYTKPNSRKVLFKKTSDLIILNIWPNDRKAIQSFAEERGVKLSFETKGYTLYGDDDALLEEVRGFIMEKYNRMLPLKLYKNEPLHTIIPESYAFNNIQHRLTKIFNLEGLFTKISEQYYETYASMAREAPDTLGQKLLSKGNKRTAFMWMVLEGTDIRWDKDLGEKLVTFLKEKGKRFYHNFKVGMARPISEHDGRAMTKLAFKKRLYLGHKFVNFEGDDYHGLEEFGLSTYYLEDSEKGKLREEAKVLEGQIRAMIENSNRDYKTISYKPVGSGSKPWRAKAYQIYSQKAQKVYQ